ncbi:MAG TPA: dienelactone hydrolase family protein [Povalibacter sp.]|uniref:dienelactone hydrolase family protein n=1 Tax=Povalibacter sp. TaxID=1962978 RepID=UPI002C59B0CE|nr:dienelactone hydrolase family protein [Povalibacter sp.]HMN44055.1 dienelactone hydrolase family protein [Povalibacter sp.]
MCDNDSFDDMVEYELRARELSRRRFGAIAMGTSLTMMLPPLAGAAVAVKEAEVEIKTPDGVCDAHFVHPAEGRHPAVLVWPDIFGLRPTFREMGKRLAESGYAVLTVNPFYRTKKAPTSPEKADFNDPATRTALMGLAGSLNATTATADAKAFIGWLDAQSAVDTKKKVGTTGYCMGGPITMRTAATLPERVGAGASFHGGGLVTDKPDSPHLLVPKMKAHYLFAIAQNDDEKQPDAKDALRAAFAAVKLPAEIEVYPAMHGWCPPDSRVYDEAQAEKAWARLLALFKTALV